jgi:PAS domain S-box-containing protein
MVDPQKGVLVFDEAGRVAWASDAACQIMGWRRDQLLHMSARDTYHPDEFHVAELRFATDYEKGEIAFRRLLRLSNGSYLLVDVLGKKLSDGRFRCIFSPVHGAS